MLITRRGFGALSLGGIGAAALPRIPRAETADGVIREHGTSLVGPLMHGPEFQSFVHTNVDAPKGGTLRQAKIGQFDTFNPYIVRGTAPAEIQLFTIDTLMATALDESQSTMYGLIAEWIEHPADWSWVAYRLRDEARWHDGTPITPEDVIFSLEILKTQGRPLYAFYYQNVTGARDMGDRVVRFDFDQTGNRELPHIVGQLPILPKHWWEGRDFAEGGLDPLLGSGPYKVGRFEPGRFFQLERVTDYWAADLPVNRGAWNFDVLHYEYYLDGAAGFSALRAGTVDYREENSAINWAEKYDFPAVQRGDVVKEEIVLEGPKGVQTLCVNLRKPRFQDRRTRRALSLAFDFEWSNRNVYFEQYARPRSYFQHGGDSDLMPIAPPDAAELALLEPFRGQIPEEVFGAPYQPPVTDGSGRNRRQLREAAGLLAEAGWTATDGRLLNAEGEQFRIEFLTSSQQQDRVILPYLDNLKRLGIDATFRVVDQAQYVRRLIEEPGHDFDMIIWSVSNSESPGNEQRDYWGSATAGTLGSRNMAGVADPAVDALIEKIIFAPDRPALAAASRALDRVLTWNHYMIFQLYTPFERVAYWNRIAHPEPLSPKRISVEERWWFDADKAAALGDGE